jgi:lysophospholipase L1-like esterase
MGPTLPDRSSNHRSRILVLAIVLPLVGFLAAPARAGASVPYPSSMAALGDSITRAADVCCWYGDHPSHSWSTGGASGDGISSHYERLAALRPAMVGHNHNDAVSGAKARDLPGQATKAVSQGVQYVTILMGANDLCTSSPSTMTSVSNFTAYVQSALATLHQGLPKAHLFVSSIPNIYQLWSVLRTNLLAQSVWAAAGICQSMLSLGNTETQRQQVVTRELAFNQVLADACHSVPNCLWDDNATYDYAFSASQVSTLDYFHPSRSGQAALARVTWYASWWA